MRLVLSACVLVFTAMPVAAGEKPDHEEGFVALFDGKSLDGWEGNLDVFAIRDGAIVGGSLKELVARNEFLTTPKEYGDFEMTFEVKVDDALNSGVQIRSVSKPEIKNSRVHGPQVEIATNGTAGYIYGEALDTGWLSEDRSNPAANAAFKKGEWNKYRVRAVGKSIKTWVNDVPVADLVDEKSNMPSGFIGLQVHGIKKETGPYEVRWRNLAIKDLTEK